LAEIQEEQRIGAVIEVFDGTQSGFDIREAVVATVRTNDVKLAGLISAKSVTQHVDDPYVLDCVGMYDVEHTAAKCLGGQ